MLCDEERIKSINFEEKKIEMIEKEKELKNIQQSISYKIKSINNIITKPLLSFYTKEFKEKFETEIKILKQNKEILKKDYQTIIAKNKKEIMLIYVSGKVIKLKKKVNIITDTLSDLYDIIAYEIKKVNIESIIINEYVYTYNNYTKHIINDSYINCDLSKQRLSQYQLDKISDKLCNQHYNKSYYDTDLILLNFLDKDYNKDYIEVTLIFCSYSYYIIDRVRDYCYHIENDLQNQILNSNWKNYFISKLSKINNDCISSYDYDKIESYIVNDRIRILHHDFLLNEIKKYLI